MIYSVKAKQTIKEKVQVFLNANSRFNGTLNTKTYCGDDFQKLHQQFQFQFKSIDDLDTLKSLGPTDLTASLGSFNLFASIASMDITTDVYNRYVTPTKTLHCTKSKAVVTHIWVYAKDSYSFQDDDKSSQYPGHWNKNGLIVLPIAAAAGKLGKMMRSKGKFEIGNWDIFFCSIGRRKKSIDRSRHLHSSTKQKLC